MAGGWCGARRSPAPGEREGVTGSWASMVVSAWERRRRWAWPFVVAVDVQAQAEPGLGSRVVLLGDALDVFTSPNEHTQSAKVSVQRVQFTEPWDDAAGGPGGYARALSGPGCRGE